MRKRITTIAAGNAALFILIYNRALCHRACGKKGGIVEEKTICTDVDTALPSTRIPYPAPYFPLACVL